MGIQGSLFRTRVARRVLILFVACSILPISALAAVSYLSLRTQLLQESEARLRDMAKNASVALSERFQHLEDVGRLVLVPLARGAFGTQAPSLEAAAQHAQAETAFDNAILVHSEGRLPLLGDFRGTVELSPEEEAHLNSGAALVQVDNSTPGAPRILLALALDLEEEAEARVWAEIDQDFLWSTASGYSALPSSAGLCVTWAEAIPVFCTFPDVYRFLDAVAQIQEDDGIDPTRTATRLFSWETDDGTTYHSALREVFLRPQFGIGELTLSVSESPKQALSSLQAVQGTFLGVFLLTLLAVAVISHSQIRRTLVPLEALKDGTRRLSGGKLRTRVSVESGDEFQDLAESFNAMSSRLEGQFKALKTAGEVDRAILSALEVKDIVQAVLHGAGELIPCDVLAVCHLEWLGAREGRLWSYAPAGESGVSRGRRLLLSDTVLGGLRVAEEPIEVRESEGLTGLLGDTPGAESMKSALVAPLNLTDGLAGFFVIAGREEVGTAPSDREHLQRVAEQLTVALSNARLLEELDRISWGALTALARAIDAKSPWTMGHSERVATVSVALGRAMDLPESAILNLQRGGLLHDIGKIGVPSEILDGEAGLSEDGRRIIRSHPEAGVRILEPIPALGEIIPIVFHHHESWDGSGYPMGLKGEEIPLEARVLAVADRFDAMTSHRPYRPSVNLKAAAAWIREEAGKTLDPTAAEIFLELMVAGKLPISHPGLEEEST